MAEMKRRFALYGFGFAMGLVLVFFFLGGKKASCNWLPNDRILNIIRQKNIVLGEHIQKNINAQIIDSLDIMEVLKTGDVDFSKSRVKNEPCRMYIVQGTGQQDHIKLSVELCDSIATVKQIH